MSEKERRLIEDISDLKEVKKADELAKILRFKYPKKEDLLNASNEPIWNEFCQCLEEISNLSNLITIAFLKELQL